jgi:hypothetical protein
MGNGTTLKLESQAIRRNARIVLPPAALCRDQLESCEAYYGSTVQSVVSTCVGTKKLQMPVEEIRNIITTAITTVPAAVVSQYEVEERSHSSSR